MTEAELRNKLRVVVADVENAGKEDFSAGRFELSAARLGHALRLVKLLTDYYAPADQDGDVFLVASPGSSESLRKARESIALKEKHPEVAAWYEKHGEKPAEIPVASSEGVHTCYKGCTHPAHAGAVVPPIGTEPLADPDDAHQEAKPAVNEDLQEIVAEQLGNLGHGPVAEVWSHYVSAHPDHKTCRLTAPRKRMIQARLKEGYTVEQLKDAITGFHLSPFHTGENDQKKRYLEFELMVRSGEQVEKGLGCLRDARQSPVAAGPTSAEIAAKEAEISATVAAAAAQVVPPPPAPPANEVEFL